jgi:Domain of unknown function (DUF4440)
MHSLLNKQVVTNRSGERRTQRWACLAALCLAATAAHAGIAQDAKTVEPRTEAAVIAADDNWGKAEETGNSAFVEDLLLPEYRSISSDGSVHDKAAILASIKKRAGTPSNSASVEQWKAAHPSRTSTVITGDTAILTFTLNRPGSPPAVLSSDIFVYREGHWRALYSQHSEAGKG